MYFLKIEGGLKKIMRKMLSLVRGCCDDYNMLKNGDNIAVGVSGGKDSLTLLYVLNELSKFHPSGVSVCGIMLDMGFENADFSPLKEFCEKIGVPFYIEKTNIKQVVFDIRKERNPCSLCAKLRRGALHDAAIKHGCRTIALGHHFDDAVETFMLSLIFESRLNSFAPVTCLDRKNVTVIRPMLYVSEKKIIGFANKYNLPVAKNPCTADGATKRQEMKNLLFEMEGKYRNLREHIFGAMQRLPLPGWEIDGRKET